MPRATIRVRYTRRVRIVRRVRVTMQTRYSVHTLAAVRMLVRRVKDEQDLASDETREELAARARAFLPPSVDDDELRDAIDVACDEETDDQS